MARYALYGLEIDTDFAFSWPVPSLDPLFGPRATRPVIRFRCGLMPPAEETARGNLEPAFPGVTTFLAGDGSQGDPDILRFGGVADHYLWDEGIYCHLFDSSLAYLAEIQLLGTVLALWLHRRGIPVLHAAAVSMGESGVAFTGIKGSGKSTLAAATVAEGHGFIADDLLACHLDPKPRQGSTPPEGLSPEAPPPMTHPNEARKHEASPDRTTWPEVHSGIPLLRLTPEQSRGMGIPVGSIVVHPAFPKRKVVVGRDWGAFHLGTFPLKRIYIPNPVIGEEAKHHGKTRFEPLPHRHRLPLLAGQSYLGNELEGWGMARSTFMLWAGFLARHQVEVFRLHYPFGFEHLPDVVAAIEAHLSG